MRNSSAELRATSGPERIDMLDAIRGFALFGILLMNLEAFNGPIMRAMTGVDSTLSGADRIADALIYIFVQGKFWTLFSLLFGMGFALLEARFQTRNDDFSRIYKRRLWGLLGIGLLHFLLIWEGDILFNYALAGFVLMWLSKPGKSHRLVSIILGYCVPLLLIALLAWLGDGDGGNAALVKQLAVETRLQGQGSYVEVSAWRLQRFVGDLGSMLALLPMTVAMFALGVRLYRNGQASPLRHLERSDWLQAVSLWVAGLMLMLASLGVAPEINPMQVNWRFVQVNVLNLLAGPLMCLGYFFGLRSVWATATGRWLMQPLAPLGRMALSNYLMQSLFCTLIFYGYGLAYFQQLPRAWHIPLAGAFIAVQSVFSAWWLRHFSMGPVEYLWRWLTYGKRPKFVS